MGHPLKEGRMIQIEFREFLNAQRIWAMSFMGIFLFFPRLASAAPGSEEMLDLTGHWAGYTAIVLFVIAYVVVMSEEFFHLRKSKPVIVAAGLIWALVAFVYAQNGDQHSAEIAVRHNILEFAELFLFLLAAMTYINTMGDRGIFDSLRGWLISQRFSFRTVYWITGVLAFFISPIADNLTTALVMSTVVMTVGSRNHKFVAIACINIVVAANAGGAFSPFGDITTLMVWQKGIVEFHEFFVLFIPSVVNWLVPAVIMSFSVPKDLPISHTEKPQLLDGAWVVVGLFLITIAMAVSAQNFLHLPPVLGMMTGLGFLKLYGYHLKLRSLRDITPTTGPVESAMLIEDTLTLKQDHQRTDKPFNIFRQMERAEWDTLMFFYGIILCVGGLGTIGYLALGSQLMYGDLGPTTANVLVGIISAIVDNIPVMFAVLTMLPDMSHGQWLLVTLTAGVGGSLLSIGSAAGVAVMGQARGIYTFFSHLKWSWAIALGYAASIWAHFLINAELFH
jgi:Na+/H+ antiporter NhaD/arsenite permease-like protein